MRRPDSYIFYLIKGMSPMERERFYYLARAKVDSPNYLELFEIIDSLEAYDEEHVMQTAGQKGMKWIGYFARVKRELLVKLIEVLREELKTTSKTNSLKLDEGLVLYDRGFTDLALKVFKTARKQFRKQENFVECMEAQKYISKILQNKLSDSEFEKYTSEVQTEGASLMWAHLRVLELEYWEVTLTPILKKKYHSSGEVDLKKLQNPDLLALLEQSPLSKRENVFILFLQFRINHFMRIMDVAETRLVQLYQLFQKETFLQIDYPEYYVRTLSARSVFAQLKGNRKPFQKTIEQLGQISKAQGRIPEMAKKFLFWQISTTLCDFPDLLSDFSQEHLNQVEQFIFETPKEKIDHFYYQVTFHWAKGHFIQRQAKASRKILRQIIEYPRKNIQTDLQSLARLLDLLCLIETGETDIVEILWRPYRAYIKKRDNLFYVEHRILKLVRDYLRQSKPSDKIKLLKEAQNDLTNRSAQDKVARNTLLIFDFCDWISKMKENI